MLAVPETLVLYIVLGSAGVIKRRGPSWSVVKYQVQAVEEKCAIDLPSAKHRVVGRTEERCQAENHTEQKRFSHRPTCAEFQRKYN